MLKKISPVLFALFVATSPAFAQFEGNLDMKMTMATKDGETGGGGGTMNIAIGKGGTRCEMNMQMAGMGMKMVMLQKADDTNTLYRIDDAKKTYTQVDLAKMREMAAVRPDTHKYTVEKLGSDTVLGYKTQHVMVKETNAGKDVTDMEMWTAKDLLDYSTFSKMQARQGRGASGEAMLKALKDAGADGLPLKSITTTAEGTKITMEVVKVDKKSLPASTFEIPADYTKSSGGLMDMMGGMSGAQGDKAQKSMDDAKQRMQDAMKNMTPEQREMMEKMMQRQAPKQ